MTAVAVHGPLGEAHRTFAVFATGSVPHDRVSAGASDAPPATIAITTPAMIVPCTFRFGIGCPRRDEQWVKAHATYRTDEVPSSREMADDARDVRQNGAERVPQ